MCVYICVYIYIYIYIYIYTYITRKKKSDSTEVLYLVNSGDFLKYRFANLREACFGYLLSIIKYLKKG